MGVYPLNESVAISRSRDKLRSLQLLARKGIGLPVTVFAHSTSQADDILGVLGGAPVVSKLLEGTQGIGAVPGGRRPGRCVDDETGRRGRLPHQPSSGA